MYGEKRRGKTDMQKRTRDVPVMIIIVMYGRGNRKKSRKCKREGDVTRRNEC